MKTKTNSRAGKITLVGSMVITAVFVSLVAMLLPAVSRPKHGNLRISCVHNQKQLGIAFQGFRMDMGGFPMQTPTTNAPAIHSTSP